MKTLYFFTLALSKKKLILAAASSIDMLSDLDHRFFDGTFSSYLDIFNQLKTIHAVLQNPSSGLLHAFLPHKTESIKNCFRANTLIPVKSKRWNITIKSCVVWSPFRVSRKVLSRVQQVSPGIV